MKKVYLVAFLMYLFISCSSRVVIPEQRVLERDLKVFVEGLGQTLEEKNWEQLKQCMLETKRNEYIYQELQKIDIPEENIQIYVKNPVYAFPKTSGIVGVQYQDRTEYFTIFYIWKDGHWFISNLEERR